MLSTIELCSRYENELCSPIPHQIITILVKYLGYICKNYAVLKIKRIENKYKFFLPLNYLLRFLFIEVLWTMPMKASSRKKGIVANKQCLCSKLLGVKVAKLIPAAI
jgi:hypothetical protein